MKNALREAWDIIKEPSNKSSQVALAIATIVVSCCIGAIAVLVYGFAVRGNGFWNGLAGAFSALLASVGSFSAGGMLGLLFGSPTWGGSEPGKGGSLGVRPNTSLERIADWLTTMIVGLSLVNLRTIRDEAVELSVWINRSITATETTNGTPGVAIALGFGFAGFMLVYLWAMRFLPNELRDSYDQWKGRAENAETALARFLETTRFVVPSPKLDTIRKTLADAGVEKDVQDDVYMRYARAARVDDEPMKDFGPTNDSKGYSLNAKAEEIGSGKYRVVVNLVLPEGSLAKNVFWLLHNTFTPDVISECQIHGVGGASYETNVDDAFWIGAIVPISGEASVRLALNLYEIDAFANRHHAAGGS